LVSILGAFQGLYVPLQYREAVPEKATKVKELGVYGTDSERTNKIISLACALESGRFIGRDIGGGDPERMAPPMVAEYVQKAFQGTAVKVEVIKDRAVFEKEYPLFAAVDRAASVIERHRGQIIFLRYEGEGPITKTIMPVGKGITYDTGGADIKVG
jgi:leucyl aminopeptidase